MPYGFHHPGSLFILQEPIKQSRNGSWLHLHGISPSSSSSLQPTESRSTPNRGNQYGQQQPICALHFTSALLLSTVAFWVGELRTINLVFRHTRASSGGAEAQTRALCSSSSPRQQVPPQLPACATRYHRQAGRCHQFLLSPRGPVRRSPPWTKPLCSVQPAGSCQGVKCRGPPGNSPPQDRRRPKQSPPTRWRCLLSSWNHGSQWPGVLLRGRLEYDEWLFWWLHAPAWHGMSFFPNTLVSPLLTRFQKFTNEDFKNDPFYNRPLVNPFSELRKKISLRLKKRRNTH